MSGTILESADFRPVAYLPWYVANVRYDVRTKDQWFFQTMRAESKKQLADVRTAALNIIRVEMEQRGMKAEDLVDMEMPNLLPFLHCERLKI